MITYFAYGSNLSFPHLRKYLDTHGVELHTELRAERAHLDGYVLRTNYFSSTHGAGACNIEPAPGHHIEGVLMSITQPVQDALRVKEGFPHRYDEIEVIVHTASTQAAVRAITYVVTPEHRLDIDLPVTARYRGLVLDGATHFGFTAAYQRGLRRRLQTTPSSSNRVTLRHAS